MAAYAERLALEVRVSSADILKLATALARDVRFLPPEVKAEIVAASPVSLEKRVEELSAFQLWMDHVRWVRHPPTSRAQVLAGNYICFCYLPDSFFKALAKASAPQSTLRRCSTYLSDGRIRSFRNAIAHANWTYRDDFGALCFWARKGTDPDEPLSRFEVENDELMFWQSLSRCVGYVAALNLR